MTIKGVGEIVPELFRWGCMRPMHDKIVWLCFATDGSNSCAYIFAAPMNEKRVE